MNSEHPPELPLHDDAARRLRGEDCWCCENSTLRGDEPSRVWCWNRSQWVGRDDWCYGWRERDPL